MSPQQDPARLRADQRPSIRMSLGSSRRSSSRGWRSSIRFKGNVGQQRTILYATQMPGRFDFGARSLINAFCPLSAGNYNIYPTLSDTILDRPVGKVWGCAARGSKLRVLLADASWMTRRAISQHFKTRWPGGIYRLTIDSHAPPRGWQSSSHSFPRQPAPRFPEFDRREPSDVPDRLTASRSRDHRLFVSKGRIDSPGQ